MLNRQLSFMKACDIGTEVIAMDALGQGIFTIDKKDMSSHLLTIVEKQQGQRNLYQEAAQYGNKIFFFPYAFVSTEVIIYDIEEGSLEYLVLSQKNEKIFGDYKPIQQIGNDVWLFPTEISRDAIKFHLDTQEIEIVAQWKEKMKNIGVDSTDVFRKVGEMIEVQNVLYQPVKGTNYILGIDKQSYKTECYALPTNIKLHTVVDYNGRELWFVDSDNNGVVSWEPVTGKTKFFPISFKDSWNNDICWSMKLLCGKQYLWMIPYRDKKIMKLQYQTGDYECIDIMPEKFSYYEKAPGSVFDMTVKNGTIVDIYPFLSNLAIHIDLENDVLSERYEQIMLPMEWTDEDIIKYQAQSGNGYETNRVSPNISMDYFIQNINIQRKTETACNNGDNIWKWVSGE